MATAVVRSTLLVLALCGLALAHGPAAFAHAKQPAAKHQTAKPSKTRAAAKEAPAKQAAMVIDANTGRVLHDQSGDEPRFPASLTKIMTLYMLFEQIEQGQLSYQSRIKISARADGMAPSKLGLGAGADIAVIDAIKALVVKSANDIAVAIAEHIGGSEYRFAQLMTERAHQIGMRATTFRNASGLPNPGQVSTARDMLTLALRLHDDFPQHYRLFSTTSFSYAGKTYKSHNTLMHGFPGMDGIKTGYTRMSGFNLVSSVKVNGKHLVAAVFGGKTAATRNAHMRALLFVALEKAATEKTRKAAPLIALRRQRPAAGPPAAAEVAWATETKAAAAHKRVRPVPPAKVPAPVPATRAARAEAHDDIAHVLAQGEEPAGDANTEEEVATAAPLGPPPRLDLEALRAAMSTGEAALPAAAAAAAPAPAQATAAPAPQDIAALIRNSIVDGVPAARQTATTSSVPASARAPSTLDSQAGALAAQAAPARPASPPRLAAAPASPDYEVQIGAFSTAQEAQSRLDSVRARAADLLNGHRGVALPVQRADKQIFRARFVNFDEVAASHACLELRRLAVDCFVMKAD